MVILDTKRIDVLSDSTGETAEKVVRAAMLQFPHSGAHIRLHTRVRTKEAARPILERAATEGALIVFTVVSPELREYIHAASYELKVEALDLIGSLIGKLATFLDRQPINMPSGMLPLTDEYFRRIEAVEFTVKSDDGKEPRNFKKADLVPRRREPHVARRRCSTILAQRGLKVANQPIVLGVRIPPELDEAPQDRIVGLTIGLDPLVEIRKARLKQLGMAIDAQLRPARAGQARSSTTRSRIFAEHPQLARHRRHGARHRGDRGHHPRVAERAGRAGEERARRAGLTRASRWSIRRPPGPLAAARKDAALDPEALGLARGVAVGAAAIRALFDQHLPSATWSQMRFAFFSASRSATSSHVSVAPPLQS